MSNWPDLEDGRLWRVRLTEGEFKNCFWFCARQAEDAEANEIGTSDAHWKADPVRFSSFTGRQALSTKWGELKSIYDAADCWRWELAGTVIPLSDGPEGCGGEAAPSDKSEAVLPPPRKPAVG